MSFFAQLGADPYHQQAGQLGQALSQGLGVRFQRGQMQNQQKQLANALFGDQAQKFENIPAEQQLAAAKLQQMQQIANQKQAFTQDKQQQDALKQKKESEILSKYLRGEELSPEEQSELSPTSQRTLLGLQKPTFEPREEALEAERVSELATNIENEYKAYQAEDMRLDRMEKLSDKGELSTPLMVQGLNKLGLPLGILGNPDSEEYAKLEADFLRDVKNVFPGGRISNFEVQSYLKTLPSLLNTPEGKKAIIRNKRLQNEAKKLRYDAYKDILKENKGKKPRNMGLLIDEKIGGRLSEIENEFKEGLQSQIEKFQQPIRMKNPQGQIFDIPTHLIEKAVKEGFLFP